MTTDNIKTEYQVILNEEISDVEKARLLEVASMCGIKHVEVNRCMIRLESDLTDKEIFKHIATWLSYIGAEEDIFVIQQIKSFYTGITSPAVKDLMRV